MLYKARNETIKFYGNNSENLLNEIAQIVYSLYQSKQIPKKVYNEN